MVQEEQRRLSQISQISQIRAKTSHPGSRPGSHGNRDGLGPFELASNIGSNSIARPSHFRPLSLERALSGKFELNRISSIRSRPSQLWKVKQFDPQLNQLESKPVPEHSTDRSADRSADIDHVVDGDHNLGVDGLMALERFDSAQSEWYLFMEDLQEYAQRLADKGNTENTENTGNAGNGGVGILETLNHLNGMDIMKIMQSMGAMKGVNPQRACGEYLQNMQTLLEQKNALIRTRVVMENEMERVQRESAKLQRDSAKSESQSPSLIPRGSARSDDGLDGKKQNVSRKRKLTSLKFTRIWTKSDERMLADIVAFDSGSEMKQKSDSNRSDSKETEQTDLGPPVLDGLAMSMMSMQSDETGTTMQEIENTIETLESGDGTAVPDTLPDSAPSAMQNQFEFKRVYTRSDDHQSQQTISDPTSFPNGLGVKCRSSSYSDST